MILALISLLVAGSLSGLPCGVAPADSLHAPDALEPACPEITAESEETEDGYFYHGRDYGSESLTHPLRMILNGGLGILQLDDRSNRLEDIQWENGWRNLRRNLADPVAAIEQVGWGRFIKSEILPFSVDQSSAQFWPNYLNHLIGGGMSSRLMREYFASHGFPYPMAWAVATMTTYHMLNETVEMDGRNGWRVDPIADIYVFDAAGIVLFTSDRVSRFFSRTLHMADWSFMPFYDPATGSIENVGQNYMIRYRLGRARPWSLFYHWCNGGEFGVTRHFSGGHSLSFGGGFEAEKLVQVDEHTDSVDLVRTAALFYDLNGSLMASLFYTMAKDSRWQLNLYPGLLRLGPVRPGFTVLVTQESQVLAGLTFGNVPLVPLGLGGRIGS